MLRKFAFGIATAFALALGIGAGAAPASAQGFTFSFSTAQDGRVFSTHGRDHDRGPRYERRGHGKRGHWARHDDRRWGHKGGRRWDRHGGRDHRWDNCRRIRHITVWYDRHGRRHREITSRRVCGGHRF